MSRFLFASLLTILSACRKPPPRVPPTPAALGAELATFPQVLVPLTPRLLEGAAEPAAKGYIHAQGVVDGHDVTLFIAYAGTWQAPQGAPLQPMSIQQFLRAFGSEAETDIAAVSAPKGTVFFTREQLPDIIAAARAAGASSADLPFALISGNGRQLARPE